MSAFQGHGKATRRRARAGWRGPRWFGRLPVPLRGWLGAEGRAVGDAFRVGPALALLVLALPALLLVYQFPRGRDIDVGAGDDRAAVEGFFPRERAGGTSFRWSGEEGRIVVPAAPGNADWTATLRLSGGRPPDQPAPPLTVLIDGRLVAQFTTSADYRDYTVRFEREPLALGDLTLTLRTETFRSPDDGRALGVQLDRVTLTPARASGGLPVLFPPPGYAALAALLLGTAASLAAGLGGGRRAVTGATAGALALILAGSAWRPDAAARALPALTLGAAALLALLPARRPLRAALAPQARALGAMLLGGLAVRLLLAPWTGYQPDIDTLLVWAERLATLPLGVFYDTLPGGEAPEMGSPYAETPLIDHLPGDLWFLWAIARLYRAVAPEGSFGATGFLVLLKLVPALADAGIALLLYAIVRRFAGARAGLIAAAAFTFNPAVVFLSAVWGQWDAVSACLALAALWLLLRGNPEWSLPTLTWAALIKPQFAALASLFALAFLARYVLPHAGQARRLEDESGDAPAEPPERAARRAGVAMGAAILVLILVPRPFDVGPPPLPARWGLVERAVLALEKFPVTSAGAFNLWASPLAGEARWRGGAWEGGDGLFLRSDLQPWALGLSYRTWGTLLFAAAYLAILAIYWRSRGRGDGRALVWACLAIAYAAFVLPTRGHERYLFPAVVFAALAAALAPRLRPFYLAVSAVYFVNLYYIYGRYSVLPGYAAIFATDVLIYAGGLLNVALLLYVLCRALPVLRRAPSPPPAEATPAGARQPGEAVARSAR